MKVAEHVALLRARGWADRVIAVYVGRRGGAAATVKRVEAYLAANPRPQSAYRRVEQERQRAARRRKKIARLLDADV